MRFMVLGRDRVEAVGGVARPPGSAAVRARRPVDAPRARRIRSQRARRARRRAPNETRSASVKTDLLLMPMGARYADMRRAAVAAEEAGFDGLWTWDHLRDPDGGPRSRVPEAWTVLTALAEVTERVALGPLVLNVNSRHPGVLANMAATLQEISGGRLLLGIGAGAHRRLPYAPEHLSIGIPVERDAVRSERAAEAVQMMKRLWAGDESSFAGSQYRLDRPSGFLRADP